MLKCVKENVIGSGCSDKAEAGATKVKLDIYSMSRNHEFKCHTHTWTTKE